MTKKKELFCFDKKFLVILSLFILGLLFIFKDKIENKLTNDNESCDCN